MVSCRAGHSFATRCACAACARLIDRMMFRSGRRRSALADAVNRQCGDGGGLQRDRRCGRWLVWVCERDRRGEQPGQTHKTTAALATIALPVVRRLGFLERRVRGARMPANLGKESLQPGRRSGCEVRRRREKAGRRQLEQESKDCEGRREASAAAQSAGSRTARAEQRAQLASASSESCRGGRSSSSWSGRAVG